MLAVFNAVVVAIGELISCTILGVALVKLIESNEESEQNFYRRIKQHRTILSADTASRARQMLSKKRRQYFVYYRAFLPLASDVRSRRSGA